MKLDSKSVAAFHCPKWEELPAIALYMDQVVMVLQEALAPFTEEEPVTTPAMINSYVKQKLIPPPHKKKYGREQLSMLVVIILLKRVLSMTEIQTLLRVSMQENSAAAYNSFCTQFELLLRQAFCGETTAAPPGEFPVVLPALSALVSKLYAQYLLAGYEEQARENEPEKPEKKNKKQ